MTILDYLLLGGFAAALLYTGSRLFVGWLRAPSHEIQSETSDMPNSSTIHPSAVSVLPVASTSDSKHP